MAELTDKTPYEIGLRIQKYRVAKEYSRQKMAGILNTSVPNYGNIERGEQMPTLVQVQALVSYTKLPYEFWVDGVSNTYLPDNMVSESDALLLLNPSDTIIMYAPLVPHYAYAGYLSGYSDPEYIESLPTVPWIVEKEHKGTYRSFEVRNNSMTDGSIESYEPGDKVLGREIARDLWKSKLHYNRWKDFVILHKKDGIILKRIVNHDVENRLVTLHSLNPDYIDYDLNLEDVAQLFNVVQFSREKR